MSSSATDMKAPLLTADSKSSDVVVSIDEKISEQKPVLPIEQLFTKLRSATKAKKLIEYELPVAEELETKKAIRRGRNWRLFLIPGALGLGVGVKKAIETAISKGNIHESYQDSYNNLDCSQPMPSCTIGDNTNSGPMIRSAGPVLQSLSGLTDVSCDELSSAFCDTRSDYSGYLALASFTILAGLILLLSAYYIRKTSCVKEKTIMMSDLPEDKKTELSAYHLQAEVPAFILLAPLVQISTAFSAHKFSLKEDNLFKAFFESRKTAVGFRSIGLTVSDIKKEDRRPIHRLFSQDGRYDVVNHILSYIEPLPESKIKLLKRG